MIDQTQYTVMKAPRVNAQLVGKRVLFAGFDNRVYRAHVVGVTQGIADLRYTVAGQSELVRALVEPFHHNRIFEVTA